MKISISRRQQYFIYTLINTGLLFLFINSPKDRGLQFFLLIVFVTIIGQYLINKPNTTLINTLISSIVNLSLVVGFALSYIYFPNLSKIFKFVTLAVFAGLYYLSSLINNVFLVVEYRKEVIPLYRVALTWSKIILVTISIPLLAGLFKVSINPLAEAAIASVVSFAYYAYFIWVLRYNKDVKKYKAGEIGALFLLGVFLVFCACLSVVFFPSEAFLRALFVSSVFIFGITYLEGHLKNTINRQLITEHIIISIIFFILTIIFTA